MYLKLLLVVLIAIWFALSIRPSHRHELICSSGTVLIAYSASASSTWKKEGNVWMWNESIAYKKSIGETCRVQVKPIR